jgi:hypothetical protein
MDGPCKRHRSTESHRNKSRNDHHQTHGGKETDYGTVGFQKDVSGQILIFPKSLKEFAGLRIIAVKYDLLDWPAIPKNQQAPKARPPRIREKAKPQTAVAPGMAVKQPSRQESLPATVVEFPRKTNDEDGPDDSVEQIKTKVRQAMKMLEEGKHVAAFNLLKRIVES